MVKFAADKNFYLFLSQVDEIAIPRLYSIEYTKLTEVYDNGPEVDEQLYLVEPGMVTQKMVTQKMVIYTPTRNGIRRLEIDASNNGIVLNVSRKRHLPQSLQNDQELHGAGKWRQRTCV